MSDVDKKVKRIYSVNQIKKINAAKDMPSNQREKK